MKRILVTGKEKEGTDAVLRSLGRLVTCHAASANNLEEVKSLLDKDIWDLLMICGGFTQKEEASIFELQQAIAPGLKTLIHYGGGSGLLLAELKGVIDI